MRLPSITPTLLLTLLPSILALTINYPTTSSTIDPTQPFVITWTSSSSDPNTISLQIHETNPTVLATDQILADGIQTSAGTFTVPASTINEFGTGFVIQALDGGNVIATSGTFALGAGSGAVSTLSNGGETFVSVRTDATATTTTAATSTAEVPATSAAASSGAASASTQGGASTATETATASTSSMVLTPLVTGSSSREGGSTSASSSRYVTSQTLVDTSPSSTTGASATSTGLAGGKLSFGGLGLVGGVMGALAVLV